LRQCVTLVAVTIYLAAAAAAAPLQPITSADPTAIAPSGGGGDSWRPIVSPDGRYVLFASRAENLVLAATNFPFLAQPPVKENVYLRDRLNGTTTLVSINFSGTGPGNGDSIPTALSTNGQLAAFESTSSDLVPGDTNNTTQIYVRDIVHETNLLVSVSTNGGFGNGNSWESTMTPDGRYVAYASSANNLVPNDRNGVQDIFVRDTVAGVTMLASPNATGGSSDAPQITPDGRFVVFRSTGTGLVYSNSAITNEIYIRDLVANTTTLASTNGHVLFTVSPNNYNQAISDDGNYVAFESSPKRVGAIQRYNVQLGVTDLISSNAVVSYAYNHFRSLDMSPDGRFIAFVGFTDTNDNSSSVYIWDALSATATPVSTDLDGTLSTNSVCEFPVIDSSGRWVAFFSTATNLTTNVVAGSFHLFVHDSQTGTTALVDSDTNGLGLPKDLISIPSLTPDGHFIAFDASDANLVANDNNNAADVFVCDLNAGTNEMISVHQPLSPSRTARGSTLGAVFSVSGDGRYISFSSAGNALLPNGYTNSYRGVCVRDQINGTNTLASVDTNGLTGADGWSFEPSLSTDGRFVAFTSGADNLVTGDTNGALDVFVRDMQLGLTTLVSLNKAGNGPGNAASYSPIISTNGRYVLFHSLAGNLANGAFPSGTENLFLRDLQRSTNYALTVNGIVSAAMTPDGRYVAYDQASLLALWNSQTATQIYTKITGPMSPGIAVSPDGNRIAYSMNTGFYVMDLAANSNLLVAASILTSHAGLQFSADSRYLVYATTSAVVAGDTNKVADVYLYDFQTHSNSLVSQSCLRPNAGNAASDSPTISADGRFIAYRSYANDLVVGDTNNQPDVFIFDRQTSTTTLVSASLFGDFAANNRSLAPTFSSDSQTLVFSSWASDLTAGDFNEGEDLFALKLYGSIAAVPLVGEVIYAPAKGQSPLVTWPANAGTNFMVQFKSSLSDPSWQNLNVEITVLGDRAYATDITPGAGQRFYRIVAY